LFFQPFFAQEQDTTTLPFCFSIFSTTFSTNLPPSPCPFKDSSTNVWLILNTPFSISS